MKGFMADTMITPAPRKRRGWLRALTWILSCLIVLLIVAYFVATSSAFFKGVILPRVGKSLNADITVSDASIHPFSHVILRDLKIQAKGEQPVLAAPEVRARYHLFSIIGGNIRVDEVALVSPNVLVLTKSDGTSNLDPITRALKEKPGEKEKKPSKPAQVDVRDVTLSGGTVRLVKEYAGGNRDVTSVSNLNFTVNGVKNDGTGKMQLKGDIQVANNPPSPGTNGLLAANLNGNFEFSLTPDLAPGSAKGETRIAVTRAEGSFAEFSTLNAVLACDMTPTEIREAALRFEKGTERLGELHASGPFDAQKIEGRVKVELVSLDKRLLNTLGSSSGLDFGPTTITSTNEIQFTKSGAVVNATGQLDVGKLQVTRAGATTPALDVHAEYDVTVDRSASVATLRKVNLNGTQSGRPLLLGRLTNPMNIAWGNANNQFGNASLDLIVTNFNLVDWKPFLRDTVGGGMLNATLDLTSQANGKQLGYNADARFDDLSAKIGSNQVTQAGAHLRARGQATDLKQFRLDEFAAQLTQQNQQAVIVSGAGGCDTTAKTANMDVNLQASLPQLFRVMAQPDVSASSGTIKLTAKLAQKDKTKTVTGNLSLADFTGKFGNDVFQAYGTSVDLDVNNTPDQIQIRKVSGRVTQGGSAGGSFNLDGTCTPSSRNMQLNLKLADLNQNALRPFLEPMLTGKKLNSVSVNGDVSVHFAHNADSSLKANLQVTNLVVSTPGQMQPAAPLEARIQTDATLQKEVAELKQFLVTLTPTPRAKNELNFSGRVDFSDTNAVQGSVKLTADSLDVTKYYDLFSGDTNKVQKPSAEVGTPSQSILDLTKEPDAIHLPVKNFTIDANIGKLYLREVEITNLATLVKLDGGRVLLNPMRLALNGAPINATANLDLGVPGYSYDLSFKADRVPLAPLVNSFEPERKGEIGGTLNADAQIKGAGLTGTSLQKNLGGNFTIGMTNLNLSVLNLRSPVLKSVVNVIAAIPEMLRNPESSLTSLFSNVTGRKGAGSHGGLADELQQSPIDVIAASGAVGQGRIDLKQAVVRSPAFEADAQGNIQLAAVLTNSPIKIPVRVSLSRSIVERLRVVSSEVATNVSYVKLPDFLTLGGTVGEPKEQINKLALARATLQTFGGGGNTSSTNDSSGLMNRIGGEVQSIFRGGNRNQTNGANTTTNQPATNQSPINDLRRRFGL